MGVINKLNEYTSIVTTRILIPSKEKNDTDIHRISFKRFHILIANKFKKTQIFYKKFISKTRIKKFIKLYLHPLNVCFPLFLTDIDYNSELYKKLAGLKST